MLYIDLFEAPELILEGYFKWLFVIIDDYIWYGWDYGLKIKNQVKVKWLEWLVFVKKQHGDVYVIRIKTIRSDNEGEFIDEEL